MFTTARQAILAAVLVASPAVVQAQATWQPSTPPLVTAENETWFRAGQPIIWAGDYYYPAGTPRFFSPNEMVRSGSFRGIPLYTDATLDPYSIVYVPIAGGLMQPYQRRRDGALAGTTGSTTPAFPPAAATEMPQVPDAAGVAEMEGLRQALSPPAYARAYDVAPPGIAPAAASEGAVATSGRAVPVVPAGPVETAEQPQGINGIWITYDGRRWFAGGEAISLGEARFTKIGTYHGFPVYQRDDDTSRVYIPAADGLVAPFSLKR
ncbi:MAG TPA: hypothetical protein VL262_12530 [Vicinamibacterales bacterium]|nr:hypothetical protein [Vicinamibacterales bacterium]